MNLTLLTAIELLKNSGEDFIFMSESSHTLISNMPIHETKKHLETVLKSINRQIAESN